MTRCPICGKLGENRAAGEANSPYPFCSDRCKLRDLGRWLSDAYQIPVEPADDGDDEARPDAWIDPNARDRRR